MIALFVVPAYPGTRETFKVVGGVMTLALPAAILLGQFRGDVFAAMSLWRIAVRASGKPLTPVAVEKVIGDALGDSTIALAVWAPDRAGYVDVYGTPLELPNDTRTHGVTHVTHGNGPVAALIHDPTLDTDPDVVEGLAATSLMLLENTRLVEELRASRSRIVEAGERERRRLERDLHDGAQQRLVAIQIGLDIARELAHGIYPGVLQQLGPAAALRSLARVASVPIEVVDEGMGRSSEGVEAAIYFCAREAIQNAAKHAGPGATVTVRLARREDAIEVTVSDRGAGMPPGTHTSGTGLRACATGSKRSAASLRSCPRIRGARAYEEPFPSVDVPTVRPADPGVTRPDQRRFPMRARVRRSMVPWVGMAASQRGLG